MTGDPPEPPPSDPSRRRLVVGGLLAVLAGAGLTLFVPRIEYHSRIMGDLNDLAHVPLFGLVLWGLAHLRPFPGTRLHDVLRLLRLLFFTVLLGGLVELLQAPLGRTPELADVGRDAGGAGIAILLILAFRPWQTGSGRVRLVGGAALLATLFVFPTLVGAYDGLKARASFPVLADFESVTHLLRVKPKFSRIHRARLSGERGRWLEVEFLQGLYPRLGLHYFPRDWSEYDAFTFRCHNPGTQEQRLFVRIDDLEHDGTTQDRFRLFIEIAPGENRITIPLQRVAEAPESRRMEMTAIRSVVFYLFDIQEPVTLLFDDFRLEDPRGADGSRLQEQTE